MKVVVYPKNLNSPHSSIAILDEIWKHLPSYGFSKVDTTESFDLVTSTVLSYKGAVDILHLHGMMYIDFLRGIDTPTTYGTLNKNLVLQTKKSRVVTFPSKWSAECFRREFRRKPYIVRNGIELNYWKDVIPEPSMSGYVLWNKQRVDETSNPIPAYCLSQKGVPVAITKELPGRKKFPFVLGVLSKDDMARYIAGSSVYLSTTRETGTIGMVEALACGVPVLGYRWGANLDVIVHKENGYLATPYDIDDLYDGYKWILKNYPKVSERARTCHQLLSRDWSVIVKEDYVPLYEQYATNKKLWQ
jgi:hypothetical protein